MKRKIHGDQHSDAEVANEKEASLSGRSEGLVIPFQPFQPDAEFDVTRRNLPHWTQPGVTYYVTFRLADSLPAATLRQWQEERNSWKIKHPRPWSNAERDEYEKLFYDRLDAWLDMGRGDCTLENNVAANILEDALHFFDGQRYLLDAYVIMPNHVHLLVAVADTPWLSKVLHSWKSFTAHEINKALGRSGTLWQDESFDHIVRSVEQLNHYRSYIQGNPASARIQCGYRLGRGKGISESYEECT